MSGRLAHRLADGKPTGVLPDAALRLHRVEVGSPFQGFAAAMSSLHWPERWLGSMAASCVAGVPLCFTACLMSCAPTGLYSHCRFARPPKGGRGDSTLGFAPTAASRHCEERSKSKISFAECRAFRRSQSGTSTSRGFYYGRKCTEKMVYGGLQQSVFLHQLAEFFVGDAFPLRFVIYGNERHICAIGLYEDSVGDDSRTTAFAFGF